MVIASQTDAEVIASSLDRPERFEAIFDRHAVAIYRYLRRRVGDQLADELTAETFTRAIHARGQFDTRHASALPWLYGIAVNLVRMHLRSEHRRRSAYRRFAANPIQPSSTTEVDARLDAQALGPVLSAVLVALSADEREVLLLHAWAGLSPGEIAEALCVQGATVRKRLHRARAKAAQSLERHDSEVIGTVSRTRRAQ
jgi:RNA polymerase sigma-70 factor (ECF subfamily)